MCDYSLHSVKSRPARVGDKLTTRNFNTGTRGFAAPEDASISSLRSSGNGARVCQGGKVQSARIVCLEGKYGRLIRRRSSGKSIRTTREHIMMRWNFQTGRPCW